MHGMTRKMMGTALAAVLVFNLALPGSSFVKPEKAEAIAPAIPFLVVFGTACAAGGVYAAGTTLTQYNANLQSLYDGMAGGSNYWSSSWQQYVQDQGSFQNAMNSVVTEDGTISLQQLNDAGFFDSLNSYSAYCVENGNAVVNENSKVPATTYLKVGETQYNSFSSPPAIYSDLSEPIANVSAQGYTHLLGYQVKTSNAYIGGSYISPHYIFYFSSSADQVFTYSKYGNGYRVQSGTCATITCGYAGANVKYSTGTASFTADPYDIPRDWYVGYINASTVVHVDGQDVGTYEDTGGVIAGIDSGGVGVDSSLMQSGAVQPFDPTAEQLEAGFSKLDVVASTAGEIADTTGGIASDVSDILSAISTTIGGTLNDIKTGVNGLSSAIGSAVASGASTVVNGLSGVLNDIKTGVNGLESVIGSAVASGASTVVNGLSGVLSGINTTVGTISGTLDDIWGGAQGWWTDLLAWLGATPLAQLIAQIIAAIQAGVLSLEGAISAVQAWISAAVADIVGAIEGIQIPTFELPEIQLPTFYELDDGSGSSGLDGGNKVSAFSGLLHEKAPFAYMFAFTDGMQAQGNTYSQNPSFKISHTFEILGQDYYFEINAEPYLLYDLGGTTIAYLLRMCVSMTLCMGLLYAAYRTGLAAVRNGG